MRKSVAAAVLIALIGVAVAARQDVHRVPGPGTGIVKVTGTVDVGTLPPVDAVQRGDWKVAVTSAPPTVVAPAAFLKVGGVYAITWSDGTEEVSPVEEILPGNWVRTAGPQGGRRWVNLTAARSVQERR